MRRLQVFSFIARSLVQMIYDTPTYDQMILNI